MSESIIQEGGYSPRPIEQLRDAVDCYLIKLGNHKGEIDWRWAANDIANMVALAARGRDYTRYTEYVGERI